MQGASVAAKRTMSASLLCLSIAVVLLSSSASAQTVPTPAVSDVALYVSAMDGSVPPVSVANISCRLSSDLSGPVWVAQPGSMSGPSSSYGHFAAMPSGTYTCRIDVPGFYAYDNEYYIYSGGQNGIIVYLIPISYGITMYLDNSKFSNIETLPNMTLSAGSFPGYDYATTNWQPIGNAITSNGYHFGAGMPSSVLIVNSRTFRTWALPAGTYRYGISTMQGGNLVPGPVKFFIFGGLDQQNGVLGVFTSNNDTAALNNATMWYAGDIVVTNPGPGCSTYSWQNVDQYLAEREFPQTSNGNGTEILTECLDMSPAAQSCNTVLYNSTEPISTCGAFGDPHILMFNETGVTCGIDTTITLLDNDFLTISALTEPTPNATNGATDMVSVTLEYKGFCNPFITTFQFNGTGGLTPFLNSPTAGNQRARVEGNNIFIDSLRLRLQVRLVSVWTSGFFTRNVVTFGLSLPSSLAGVSTGICSQGCPAGTTVDISAKKRALVVGKKAVEAAQEICEEAGLAPGTFMHDACAFDVVTTGNDGYAAASVSGKSIVDDVKTAWEIDPISPGSNPLPPIIDVPSPVNTPSPASSPAPSPASSAPSAAPVAKSPPSNAASSLVSSIASVVALLALAAVFC